MKSLRLPTKDPVVLVLVLALLIIFFAGLASQSQEPILLGKSTFLWALIILSGGCATGLILVLPRVPVVIKIVRTAVLLTIITAVLFEAIGWVFPKVLPVSIVQRLPRWTMHALPEEVFEQPGLRMLRLKGIDDRELGYRGTPNAEVRIQEQGFDYVGISDSLGFSNRDETLYTNADIILTGDSFTLGWGVEFHESWAQQLAKISGRRVLNLGMGSWAVYQFPRVMERYAPDANPDILLVTLLSQDDLVNDHYGYADYLKGHPHAKGIVDYTRGNSRWRGLKREEKSYINVGYELFRYAFPFTTSAYSVLRTPHYGYTYVPPCQFWLNEEEINIPFHYWDQFYGNEKVSTLDRVSDDLNRVVELGQRINAQVYFLYLPYAEEVYIPLLESATGLNECAVEMLKEYQAGKFNFRKYYDQYEEALTSNADLLIDATPYLRKFAMQGEQHNLSFDPHPNPTGYRRIAEFVAQNLN